MRLTFVSANRERLPDPVVPLGLLYVMASTPPHHDKRLVDLCFEDDPLAVLRADLLAHPPDLVALGLRNLQNSDYSGIDKNLAWYGDIVRAIREVSAAPVVLGGAGFSVMPAELMAVLRGDYGIAGEAEAAFPALLAALERGEEPSVAGLFRRQDDTVAQVPPAPGFLDLSGLPVPDRSLVDPRYAAAGATASVQTSRGCPLRCAYCTYPLIESRSVRRRTPEAVADELLALGEVGHVFVVDSVFTLPPRHAKAVCRELIRRGWRVPWTAYANPIGFDRELAELMVAAGCAGVEVGTDSGHDEVLTRQRKGFCAADVVEMHAHCQAAGLRDCHTFVLGLPGETVDTVQVSLDFLHRLDPAAAILMLYTDDREAVDPELARGGRALRSALGERVAAAAQAHPRWVAPQLGVRFDLRLFRVLRKMGLQGPLWQHLGRL